MKILLLNHNVVGSAGTYLRAFHFGRELARRGHEIDLISISPRRRFRFEQKARDGITILGSPDLFWGRGRTGWDPWDCVRRAGRIRHGEWDLVHAFDSRPVVILPALLAQRRGIPLVMDWADWWGRGGTIDERPMGWALRSVITPVETWFEEHFRTRADRTTVISSALEQRAVAHGVAPGSILRIPQGSDVENVVPGDRARSRTRLGFPATAPILCYMGALLRGDARFLFDAFSVVRKVRPDVRLVMVGTTSSLVPDDRSIIQTGFVSDDDKLDALAAADVLLLPMTDTIASRGRWPSKINDYLAAGRPIVATAVGDCHELFANHRIGIATAVDAEAFAAAVLALLDDRITAGEMGATARNVAERVLAWPILTERLESLYLSIAPRSHE